MALKRYSEYELQDSLYNGPFVLKTDKAEGSLAARIDRHDRVDFILTIDGVSMVRSDFLTALIEMLEAVGTHEKGD